MHGQASQDSSAAAQASGSSPSGRSSKTKSSPPRVFAFECTVKGTDWTSTVNHFTRSKARYDYLLGVRESYPDITFADILVRKVGAPRPNASFARTAAMRGMPELQCGQRVMCGDARGTIVGSNDSCNFDVLFDPDCSEFPGMTLNVHPLDMQLLPE